MAELMEVSSFWKEKLKCVGGQGFHFRFFDASGLVPPLAPGLMPLDFRLMPLDLSPPIKFGWGGMGGTAFELLQNV